MQRIGKHIRDRRLALGLSVPRLANAAETTTRYMEMIEAGSRYPSLMTLFRIAAALDTTASELLVGVEAPLASVG
ncbi:helix-turn-helix domain-containing protein [Actinomadura violacea]